VSNQKKTEKQSAAYGDCQFPNKNSNYIAREIWNIFAYKNLCLFHDFSWNS